MKVYLNSVDGISDAIASMYMSKRNWTTEIDVDIRTTCKKINDCDGKIFENTDENAHNKYTEWMGKLLKWGVSHITMLKFIDLSFTVEELHRGGQDDWDSHAKRFDNRIIRSSTRLADYQENEMSDFYQNKIIPTNMALDILEIEVPDSLFYNGDYYVKSPNGYVLEHLANNKDVRRGLYLLSIPSNFIFRCNLADFAHVYQERGAHSNANPEVKEMAEKMVSLLQEAQPQITKDVLMKIKN